jgi:hypothetical protein
MAKFGLTSADNNVICNFIGKRSVAFDKSKQYVL